MLTNDPAMNRKEGILQMKKEIYRTRRTHFLFEPWTYGMFYYSMNDTFSIMFHEKVIK